MRCLGVRFLRIVDIWFGFGWNSCMEIFAYGVK